MNLEELKVVDADVAAAIEAEMDRQNSHIELIASENWVSDAVMEAQGSIMTNKYAEGYPGKRYYGGCQCVDIVENLAIERAKELFDAEYVNVQPHSGAQANMAVQFALLQPGDTVMGMNLDHGGHLTHGSPVNFSGTYFHIVPYGVNDEGFIDYDKVDSKESRCVCTKVRFAERNRLFSGFYGRQSWIRIYGACCNIHGSWTLGG